MNHAGATIELVQPDEQAADGTSELVVTIKLKLGSGPASPATLRLTEFLQRLAAGEEAGTQPAVPTPGADSDPRAITIFADSRTVWRGTREIALTRREFDLLLCLADNPLRVYTRAQLLAQVWNTEYTGPRSVDVHVLRLRAKVGLDLPLVQTLRGVGYRLHASASVAVVRGR